MTSTMDDNSVNDKNNEKLSINKSEFFKGVKFALDELSKGKSAEEILAAL